MIRYHVRFSGHVQGVGFRYTTRGLARTHGVAGWVRNLMDGSVEIMAEADEDTLRSFLEDVKDRFSLSHEQVKVVTSPATGEFQSFDIAF